MNFLQRTFKSPITARSDSATLGLLLGGTAVMLMSVAALNGGTAVAASVWDGLQSYLKDMLNSSFVLVLGLIALVALVWQIAHGRGYQHVGAVLGVLAAAVLGPGLVTAAATATRDPAPVVSQVHTPAAQSVTSITLRR